MWRRAVVVLASGAGLGYSPLVPGTVGTIYGVVLHPLFDALRLRSTVLYVAAFLALVAFAVWIAGVAEGIFSEHDPSRVTIDEAAGYIATSLFFPMTLASIAWIFAAFRLFDILKLWPASYFDQRAEGGKGVVLDDVFAGLYANVALRAVFWATGITL